jgi:hypothetical protein
MTLPPKGITAVWRMMWSLKMAMSVVPPPMSTRTTPASFSSGLSTASALARGSRISSVTSSPARATHLLMLRAAVTCPVMMWKLASRRTPLMPMGSLMPCSLSTMYSWGSTWMISSPGTMASLYMSSISWSMSLWRISCSRLWRVIMPRWCMLRMCCPAMPTFTVVISTPALSLGLHHGGLDAVHGALDVGDHPAAHAIAAALAHAHDLELPLLVLAPNDAGDLGGADVQPGHYFLFVLHVLLARRGVCCGWVVRMSVWCRPPGH